MTVFKLFCLSYLDNSFGVLKIRTNWNFKLLEQLLDRIQLSGIPHDQEQAQTQ